MRRCRSPITETCLLHKEARSSKESTRNPPIALWRFLCPNNHTRKETGSPKIYEYTLRDLGPFSLGLPPPSNMSRRPPVKPCRQTAEAFGPWSSSPLENNSRSRSRQCLYISSARVYSIFAYAKFLLFADKPFLCLFLELSVGTRTTIVVLRKNLPFYWQTKRTGTIIQASNAPSTHRASNCVVIR